MVMAKRTRERPLSRGFRFQPGWRSAWEDSGWEPPPNLLFIPDKDGDDKADVDEIEVRLTGWGIRDRHETLNSFIWGPDGWLYGLQGFATPSRVGKPKGKGLVLFGKSEYPERIEFDGEPVDINGGVWRYHPTKERFEVVSHGFSNPWGIDYDAKGQLFITACVIPHLWHVIPVAFITDKVAHTLTLTCIRISRRSPITPPISPWWSTRLSKRCLSGKVSWPNLYGQHP